MDQDRDRAFLYEEEAFARFPRLHYVAAGGVADATGLAGDRSDLPIREPLEERHVA